MRWVALIVLLLAAPAKGQEPAPFLLRIAVSPDGPVWVGQRISVTLTAMTPVRFAAPPSWPDLVASQGRIIVLPEGSTVPGTERIGGESYAALQHSYSIVTAEAGDVVLAPIGMRVRVMGADGQPMEAEATTAESRITARLPPGVRDVTRLVVAPSFRMTAATEGETREIHVGDAVVRTLRMEADDTTAMLLPPGAWGQPEGVRVYPDPPVLQDRSDRGVYHALRTERVAFVPQRPGRLELPGFSVSWFEPRSGRLREMKVDPLEVQVLPAPASGARAETGGARSWMTAAGIAGLVLLTGALLLWWRRRPRHRQPRPIAPLAAACHAGDAQAALRALYRWCDAVLPPGGDRTIGALALRADVPDLAQQAAMLEAKAFGGDGMRWNGAALLDAARTTERAFRHPSRGARPAALPALNPINGTRLPPRLTQPRWAR